MKKIKYRKKLIFISLIMILIGAVSIIYSFIKFPNPPDTRDWNYIQVKKIESINNNPDKFSFAVFGDNKNSIRIFEKLINVVNNDSITFSIDTGDLIDNRIDGESEYRFFLNQIKKLNDPMVVIPGNHETEGSSGDYNLLFGRLYYSFTFGDAYFITLNGSHEEGIGPEQYNWLINELKKSQKYKYKFLFMHIPLYNPRTGKCQDGYSIINQEVSEGLNNLFDENKVTMIFTSHFHGYFTGKWNKTPFIITGGAGAELGGISPNHFFNHYIKVNVSKENVNYEVIKTGEPFSNKFTLFIRNATEMAFYYFKVHWDYMLLGMGVFCLGFAFKSVIRLKSY